MSAAAGPTDTVPVLADAAEALAVARRLAAGFAVDDSRRDRERRLPRAEVAGTAASGLLGITVPRRFGGAGVDARTAGEVMAVLAEGDASLGQIPQNHFFFVEVLTEVGTEEQQRFFAAEVLAGRHFGNALSERGSRTASEYTIRFERRGDDVLLDGTKYYATGSPFAPWIPVYASDPEGGVVAVWVPADSPGVSVVDDWAGMGQRGTGSGTVRFDEVVVAGAHVVPVSQIFSRPEVFGAFGNYLHAAIDVGIAEAALRDGRDLIARVARPWAEAEVDRAVDDPLVIQGFGELALRVRTARALLHEAGDAIDAARADLTVASAAEASIAVAAARAGADEAAVGVSSDVFALIGARASSDELNLHRHWRNARTHTLHDPRRAKIAHIGRWALHGTPPPSNGWV